MKKNQLKSMEHIVKFENGEYGLIVEWNGQLNVQYEYGYDYLTTWNNDLTYRGAKSYKNHSKNIISVYKNKNFKWL